MNDRAAPENPYRSTELPTPPCIECERCSVWVPALIIREEYRCRMFGPAKVDPITGENTRRMLSQELCVDKRGENTHCPDFLPRESRDTPPREGFFAKAWRGNLGNRAIIVAAAALAIVVVASILSAYFPAYRPGLAALGVLTGAASIAVSFAYFCALCDDPKA